MIPQEAFTQEQADAKVAALIQSGVLVITIEPDGGLKGELLHTLFQDKNGKSVTESEYLLTFRHNNKAFSGFTILIGNEEPNILEQSITDAINRRAAVIFEEDSKKKLSPPEQQS